MNVSESDFSIGYQNGQWRHVSQLHWHVKDTAALFAATAVERLRTFNGRPCDVGKHYLRMCDSVKALRIESFITAQEFEALIEELLQQNEFSVKRHGDVSIVILSSNGLHHSQAQTFETLIAYLDPLPWKRLHERYTDGVPLYLSDIQNISAKSWSPQIKSRCRLQYFLADAEASDAVLNSVALLLDENQFATDTSIANIVIAISGRLYAPRNEAVLNGITLKTFASLLPIEEAISFEDLSVQKLSQADEILLFGTTGQVHAASSLYMLRQGHKTHRLHGVNGQHYRSALKILQAARSFNFADQAAQKASNLASRQVRSGDAVS